MNPEFAEFQKPKKIRVELAKFDDNGELVEIFVDEEVIDADDDGREDPSGSGLGR